jgi:hypothetical protein
MMHVFIMIPGEAIGFSLVSLTMVAGDFENCAEWFIIIIQSTYSVITD